MHFLLLTLKKVLKSMLFLVLVGLLFRIGQLPQSSITLLPALGDSAIVVVSRKVDVVVLSSVVICKEAVAVVLPEVAGSI